jgi:tartrate/fumarate subfamily iron-sulfur-dependent hydro-lyase beta chain
MITLTTPISEQRIRSLNLGDEVLISGTIFTGRDAVHKYLHEGGKLPPEVNLKEGVLYHCGPVVIKDEQGNWKATAAGPTTSIREEPYQADVIKEFGLRGVIGKGGMGDKTLNACAEYGAVYFHAIGGVRGVYFMEEFGAPEAIWEFEVENFPVVVTMDSHGKSLHREVLASSQAALAERL